MIMLIRPFADFSTLSYAVYVTPGILFAIYSVTVMRISNDDGEAQHIVEHNGHPSSLETAAGTRAVIRDPSIPVNWRNLTDDQLKKMSALGKRLMLQSDESGSSKASSVSIEEYRILIWKHGGILDNRHMMYFYMNGIFSPWHNCSVNNCRLSYDSREAEMADAILFHMRRSSGPGDLPKNISPSRRISQRWVFFTDEPPGLTFCGMKQNLSSYNGLFNWSMTYRMDSDVPVPYGRTVVAQNPGYEASSLLKRKSKLVAIMGSVCDTVNNRWNYVAKLKDSLEDRRFDVFGRCLNGDTMTCPGHFFSDCEELGSYKFYLAFENSNCREYLTEKVFWHGYQKHSVPVIMGTSRDDCRQLLPPGSYLHVDDFVNGPEELAEHLRYLDDNDDEYLKLHAWRKSFEVINEHGYFQSPSAFYCRLCEGLNFNEPSLKVYDDLEAFWSSENDCW